MHNICVKLAPGHKWRTNSRRGSKWDRIVVPDFYSDAIEAQLQPAPAMQQKKKLSFGSLGRNNGLKSKALKSKGVDYFAAGDLEAPELILKELQASFSRVDLWLASTMSLYRSASDTEAPSEESTSTSFDKCHKIRLVWRYIKDDFVDLGSVTSACKDDWRDSRQAVDLSDTGVSECDSLEKQRSISSSSQSGMDRNIHCFSIADKKSFRKSPRIILSGANNRRKQSLAGKSSLQRTESNPVTLVKHRRELLAQSSWQSFQLLDVVDQSSQKESDIWLEKSSHGSVSKLDKPKRESSSGPAREAAIPLGKFMESNRKLPLLKDLSERQDLLSDKATRDSGSVPGGKKSDYSESQCSRMTELRHGIKSFDSMDCPELARHKVPASYRKSRLGKEVDGFERKSRRTFSA